MAEILPPEQHTEQHTNGESNGEIPKQHKAVVYDDPPNVSVKVVTVDTPEPGLGEVLIKLTHTGVCHSDYSVMTDGWLQAFLPYPTQKGQIGGHEGVGTIVKLGEGAEGMGRKLGERVGIKWIAGVDGTCEHCLEGHENFCLQMRVSGYYMPGTFQQYAVSPANYVTPIPEGLDSATAAPFLCAGVTVYAALKRSGAKSGQYVVIIGAGGGLGHLAVQIAARGMGLRVIGIDVGAKKDFVLSLGAEHFFDVTAQSTEELVKAVNAATRSGSRGAHAAEGAHAALVVSSVMAAYETGAQLLRRGGTLVAVGMPEGDVVGVKMLGPSIVASKSLSFVGSAVGTRAETSEVLDMAARGVVTTKFTVEPMDRLADVFARMEKGQLMGRVVLDLQA